ncbi:BREX-1 system adenine-specific DNA-methyltransferase PglX [Collinsella sp. AF05-8-2]|mgnify:CR=1 FL=1|uniref:BREX-1 system adenine-specific DNA-methyltransferase PglX n=1 Tax=unclassified Collinsella TaxID=2637548 RepID=UPI000E4D0E7D|nr:MULTISPECIES: BREX-1 system adenine-specific DNA-methyltransferase PglX [unclassified Collinsella]RGW92431.1 BREX-1 system adenine-specific DNA-methyltransferase PglX [Collinsella sp. AF05-9]RGW93075.1 BREX-1 system adenine-specific DNA-methyltransferase PglX [Collinsella sp. AF05-8-2]
MNDSALKSFCTWARTELIKGVEAQMVRYGITEPAPAPVGSETVNGLPLSPAEIEQRDELLRMQAEVGHEALRDRAAYTWFNRIVAIRFMDARGWLPSRMRMLSRADGSHGSEAVENALDVEIATADTDRIAELKMVGLDEPLWRYLFVAQCEELSDCLPGVFERVGGAMELLLPQGLMMSDGVVGKLNTILADEDWRKGVTVLGWMYQYYNADVKDEFFKAKRKAAAADIAPATQLFTPEWIVRYMVENSLGRLWMLNNPGSSLRERMEYYIEPDAEHEDFIRISSPEEITLCDPACGSGHILVYAFELLFHMYEERGYREREIPELILTKNLAGMEIDSRAAQIAELALAMCAREHDRRFFRRGVRADVTVLSSIPLGEDELPGNKKLAEELSHLGEIGSLLNPSEDEIDELKAAAASCSDDLFAATTKTKLESAAVICEKLSRRFTCTVANPPYMGSSSFNPFMSKWVKRNYPDVKSDLFSSFIVRIMDFAGEHGEVGMMTPFVWMFIGSYEKLRNRLIDDKTLTTLIQLEYSGFAGATVPICTFTYHNSHIDGYKGGYVRLADFTGPAVQAPKALEAIQNPDCGWFYRRDADTFKQIPGTPIAYWASDALLDAFTNKEKLGLFAKPQVGLQTSDNDRFLRYWFECSLGDMSVACNSAESSLSLDAKWYPHNKGGSFRKWYGNRDHVIEYAKNGRSLSAAPGASRIKDSIAFLSCITYSRITSGQIAFRMQPSGSLFDSAAVAMFPPVCDMKYLLGLLNSSVIATATSFLVPTLNAQPGDIAKLPIAIEPAEHGAVDGLVDYCLGISRLDCDSFETSWDFKRHPLL